MKLVTPILYTARYQSKVAILESGLAPIKTSLGHPRWDLGYTLAGSCKLLMPERPWLGLPRDEYEALYLAKLEATGAEAIAEALCLLSKNAGGRGLVLLCFEDLTKAGEWCHRQMFSAWFSERTGRAILELVEPPKPPKPRKPPKASQDSLF